MASTFSWVDFSEKDRQKMMDVIRLFQEQDTRDELGIGTVRDAFADMFFPGTSTIQTRIKYMLFVPWMYIRNERSKVPSAKIKDKARSEEINLIFSLLKSGDTDGVIGKEARHKLQRLPSNIYWAGLRRWGIRLFDGSQDKYHSSLDRYYIHSKKQKTEDENEIAASISNWHPAIPEPPKNFPSDTSFQLTQTEADFLKDMIDQNCNESLLAYLLNNTKKSDCAFIWQHPEISSFPVKLTNKIIQARNFSLVMHGAAILYNLMLAEIKMNHLTSQYENWLEQWRQELISIETELKQWNLSVFWSVVELNNTHVKKFTRRFINNWVELALTNLHSNIATDTKARKLLVDRENEVKRSRARLKNQRALEMWSGASGTAKLDFRWRIAKGMINDILKAL